MSFRYNDRMLKGYRFDILEEKRKALKKLSPENRKKFTQKAVAAAAKHDYDWYHKIMRWAADPTWTDVLAIAAYVGVPLDSLRSPGHTPQISMEEVDSERRLLKNPPKFPRMKGPKRLPGAREVGGFLIGVLLSLVSGSGEPL